jgi:hypothetical protein
LLARYLFFLAHDGIVEAEKKSTVPDAALPATAIGQIDGEGGLIADPIHLLNRSAYFRIFSRVFWFEVIQKYGKLTIF